MVNIATKRCDYGLIVLASVLEGLAHLKAMRPDSLEKVQSCIAQATKNQFEPTARIPMLDILIRLLDLMCSMHDRSQESVHRKLRTLQETIDKAPSQLLEAGVISIPVKRQPAASQAISVDTAAIVRPASASEETDFLTVTVIEKAELHILM